jgi:hypothetical protein
MFRDGLLTPLPNGQPLPVSGPDISSAIALNHRPDSWALYVSRHLGREATVGLSAALGVGKPAGNPTGSSPAANTPELAYRPEERRLVMSAPKVAGLFGELATNTRTQVGQDAWVTAADSAPRTPITLLVLSTDGKPLRDSQRLLLSLPTFVAGSTGAKPNRAQKLVDYPGQSGRYTLEPLAGQATAGPSGPRRAEGPLWMARQPLVIGLRRSPAPIRVYPLSPLGARQQALPAQDVRKTNEGYEIQLNRDASVTALWFEVVEDARAP